MTPHVLGINFSIFKISFLIKVVFTSSVTQFTFRTGRQTETVLLDLGGEFTVVAGKRSPIVQGSSNSCMESKSAAAQRLPIVYRVYSKTLTKAPHRPQTSLRQERDPNGHEEISTQTTSSPQRVGDDNDDDDDIRLKIERAVQLLSVYVIWSSPGGDIYWIVIWLVVNLQLNYFFFLNCSRPDNSCVFNKSHCYPR